MLNYARRKRLKCVNQHMHLLKHLPATVNCTLSFEVLDINILMFRSNWVMGFPAAAQSVSSAISQLCSVHRNAIFTVVK